MNYEKEIRQFLLESAYVEAPFLEKYKSPTYPNVIEEKEQADYSRLPKDPLVSVLVLAYNKAEYVRECVLSILGQHTSFDYEIVIAEDCSTDDTRDIVFGLQREHPDKIRVVYANANVGVMRNCLRGLRFCRGEYIAHIDGDDYCATPAKLQNQYDVFNKERDVSLVYTGGYIQYESIKFMKVPTAFRTRRRLLKYNDADPMAFAASMLLRNPMLASSVMMRTDAARYAAERIEKLFKLTGWFPCQDFELWFYCALKGKCRYLDDLSIVYRHNRGAATAAAESIARARELGDTRNALAMALQDGSGVLDDATVSRLMEKFVERYFRYAELGGKSMSEYILQRGRAQGLQLRMIDPKSLETDRPKERGYFQYLMKSIAIRLFRV